MHDVCAATSTRSRTCAKSLPALALMFAPLGLMSRTFCLLPDGVRHGSAGSTMQQWLPKHCNA